MRNTQQRGIVIGPILFIVAILAVLAAAIAAGSGEFNGDISAVKAKAQATAILDYVGSVKMGVDRVLSRCPDTQISLANSVDSGYVENPLAPSDKSCHVFNINGGGVLFKEPPPDVDLTGVPEELRHYFIHTYNELVGVGNTVIGNNSGRDLLFMLPGLNKELCLTINKMVGVGLADGTEDGDAPLGGNPTPRREDDYWANPNNKAHLSCGINGWNFGKLNCCLKVFVSGVDPRIPVGSYVFVSALHVR